MRLWLAAEAEKLADSWSAIAAADLSGDYSEDEIATFGRCARELHELIRRDEQGG